MAFASRPRGSSGVLVDDVLGEEAGDLRTPELTLRGMEDLQELMADPDHPATSGRFVVTCTMALVDGALQDVGALGVRVALSRGDEPALALWEHDGARWTCAVHREGPEWT